MNKETFVFETNTEALSKLLYRRLTDFKNAKDVFYICDRLNDKAGFVNMYKNALFGYIDGILLCERLFFEDYVKFEETKIVENNIESKAIYDEFNNFKERVIKNQETDQSEIQNKINFYTEKLKNETSLKKVKLPYYEQNIGYPERLLLKNIKEIEDDTTKLISELLASNTISFYRTMFLLSDEAYTLRVRGIEYDKFIDIVSEIIIK